MNTETILTALQMAFDRIKNDEVRELEKRGACEGSGVLGIDPTLYSRCYSVNAPIYSRDTIQSKVMVVIEVGETLVIDYYFDRPNSEQRYEALYELVLNQVELSVMQRIGDNGEHAKLSACYREGSTMDALFDFYLKLVGSNHQRDRFQTAVTYFTSPIKDGVLRMNDRNLDRLSMEEDALVYKASTSTYRLEPVKQGRGIYLTIDEGESKFYPFAYEENEMPLVVKQGRELYHAYHILKVYLSARAVLKAFPIGMNNLSLG